jgi:hypothetical protein
MEFYCGEAEVLGYKLCVYVGQRWNFTVGGKQKYWDINCMLIWKCDGMVLWGKQK